jgi:hypothetical protein
MKYILIASIVVNALLLLKILSMKKSLKDLKTDFSERAKLDSNTLIGVSGRDKEIRELADTLNETLSLLRDAYHKYRLGDAEVKTAITNIAHDLRTPLTAICGYLEMADKLEMSDEVRRDLSIISERAEYMKKLTEELFEYSVITTKEVTEEKQNVFVNKVLEDCIMNFYPSLSERGIEPTVNITEERIERMLYPTYVERIFSNLLNNALKYSDGDLSVELKDDGLFRISNTAFALSDVAVEKLFDRFFTVETARSSAGGLGLSIVRTFAQRMDCPLKGYYENSKLVIEIKF